MEFKNVGSTLKVSFPGFNIHQSTNPHYQKSVKHISCVINSNIKFNSSVVKENALHIIFIQDHSGSMSQYVMGTYRSRLDICKRALKDSVKFLSSLGDEGKDVYISIVCFSSKASIKVDTVKINSDSLSDVLKSINKIHATDTTNIGSAIDKVEKLVLKAEDLDIDKTIKILLSDGYVTYGMSSTELREKYVNYFDSTLGIGKETDYDKELLQKLTKESDERSCMKETEMNDHIVDSVFGKVSVLGTNLSIDANLSKSNLDIEKGAIVKESLSLNTYIFIKYVGDNSFTFNVDNVAAAAILDLFEKQGNPKERIDFVLLSPDYINSKDSCYVEYNYNSENDTFNIKFVITRGNTGQNNKTLCRVVDEFIDVTNTFKSIDYGKPDKKMYESLLSKIDKLRLTYLININYDFDYIDYIKLVLDEYKESVKPLLEVLSQNAFSMDVYRTASAPMRMCSAQSARSNFAFMGRLASVSYSQNSVQYDSDDDLSPQVSPAPVQQASAMTPKKNYTFSPPQSTYTPCIPSISTPPPITKEESDEDNEIFDIPLIPDF